MVPKVEGSSPFIRPSKQNIVHSGDILFTDVKYGLEPIFCVAKWVRRRGSAQELAPSTGRRRLRRSAPLSAQRKNNIFRVGFYLVEQSYVELEVVSPTISSWLSSKSNIVIRYSRCAADNNLSGSVKLVS